MLSHGHTAEDIGLYPESSADKSLILLLVVYGLALLLVPQQS